MSGIAEKALLKIDRTFSNTVCKSNRMSLFCRAKRRRK